MTVQQEAYRRIDQMSDDGIRQLLLWIDKSQEGGVRGRGKLAKKRNKAFTVPTDAVAPKESTVTSNILA